MTRIEQIQEKASELGQKYFPNEHNVWARENIEAKYVELAFIEGVKWADENPKRYSQEELCDIQLEMMKQRDKRLLDKVIKVLRNNIDLWTNTRQSIFSNYQEVYFLDNFEEDFRKAMNE